MITFPTGNSKRTPLIPTALTINSYNNINFQGNYFNFVHADNDVYIGFLTIQV